MDNDEIIVIDSDNITAVDSNEYKYNVIDCFENIPDVASGLLKNAKISFKKIEKLLYSTPAFVNLLKSLVPDISYGVVLNLEQKLELASGALKLMTKKDGTLMANLVDTKTNKIVKTLSLEKINLTPEINQAMMNFASQMQMMEIAEQIKYIQNKVEEVRQGQEYDRLATAYSCQQKLLQIMEIKNADLKEKALLLLAMNAEDSRNLLMNSQNASIKFLMEQPESYLGKILNGSKNEEIQNRINEIRENLNALNMVSLVEAISYQELGEEIASRVSLQYYADYVNKTYLKDGNVIEKLDSLYSVTTNYWYDNLFAINSTIKKLSDKKELLLDEGNEKNE